MISLIATAVVLWLGLGYITAAQVFAHFQKEFPTIAKATKKDDKRASLFIFLIGPFGLIGYFISSVVHSRGHFLRHGFDWLWPIR